MKKVLLTLFGGLCITIPVICQDYIFKPITSLDDIQDGDQVIIVAEGGNFASPDATVLYHSNSSLKGSNAMSLISNRTINTTDSKYVFNVKKKSGSSWALGFEYNSTNYYLYMYKASGGQFGTPALGTQTSASYMTPEWRVSPGRVFLQNTYLLSCNGTAWSASNGGVNNTDQIGLGRVLSGNDASGLTIFKKYLAYTLTFDAGEGTCSVSSQMGGSEKLPIATPTDNTKTFIGWKDSKGEIHRQGVPYPLDESALTADETLQAVYKQAQLMYEQVTDLSQIQYGDTLCFVLAGGKGTGPERAMYNDNGTLKLDNTNDFYNNHESFTAKYQFVALPTTYENRYFLYCPSQKQYVSFGTTRSEFTFSAIRGRDEGSGVSQNIQFVPCLDAGNHFYFANHYATTNQNYRNLVYSTTSGSSYYNMTVKALNETTNQWTTKSDLATKDGAWTIYRSYWLAASSCTFVVDGAKGACDVTEISESTFTFPDVETTSNAYTFLGWEDKNGNIYQPGEEYVAKSDMTFTALFEDTHIHYDLNGHGTWDGTDETAKDVVGVYTDNLLDVQAKSGYRFVGWSTSPTGESTIYAAGTRYPTTGEIQASTTLYAQYLSTTAFIPITSATELEEGNRYVFAIKSGNNDGRIAAVAYYNSGSYESAEVTNYQKGASLVAPPANTIMYLKKSGDKWRFYYYDGSKDNYLGFEAVQWYYNTSWESASHGGSYSTTYPYAISNNSQYNTFTLYDNYSSYYLTLSPSYTFQGYSSCTNQHASGISAYSGTNYLGHFTIYKEYTDAPLVWLDAKGGDTDLSSAVGFVDQLPKATKGDSVLVYWTDGVNRFTPGSRYPANGIVDEDKTLTAIYQLQQVTYVPINSWTELTQGDSVIFAIEDGNGGNARYALAMNGTTVSAAALTTLTNPSSQFSFVVLQVASNEFKFKHANGYYLNLNGTTLGGKIGVSNASEIEIHSWNNNDSRLKISDYPNNLAYNASANNYTFIGDSYAKDQYAENKSLSSYNGTGNYPAAWKGYKQIISYSSQLTLDAGEHGTIEQSIYENVFSLVLPIVTANEAYTFIGWTDEVEGNEPKWRAGDTYYLKQNTTLYAVYETTTITLTLDGKGTWDDGTTDDIVYETMNVTLPDIKPNYGWYFLGWATTQGASTPEYLVGNNLHSDVTITLYPVYQAVPSSKGFHPLYENDVISQGDRLLVAIEDGNGGGHSYAWTIRNATLPCLTPLNHFTPTDEQVIVVSNSYWPQSISLKGSTVNQYIYINSDGQGATEGATFTLSPSSASSLNLVTTEVPYRFQFYVGSRNTTPAHNWFPVYATSTTSGTYHTGNNNEGKPYNYPLDQWSSSNPRNLSDQSNAGTWTIYKEYDLYNYRVTYNYYPGTGAISSQTGWAVVTPDYSAATNAPANQYLYGWATTAENAANGIADACLGGERFETENTRDITLYAVYQDIVTTFDYGDGSGTTSSLDGATITLPTATPPTGYRFRGWSTTAPATNEDAGEAGQSFSPLFARTLYAVYEAIETGTIYIPTTLADIQTGDTIAMLIEDNTDKHYGITFSYSYSYSSNYNSVVKSVVTSSIPDEVAYRVNSRSNNGFDLRNIYNNGNTGMRIKSENQDTQHPHVVGNYSSGSTIYMTDLGDDAHHVSMVYGNEGYISLTTSGGSNLFFAVVPETYARNQWGSPAKSLEIIYSEKVGTIQVQFWEAPLYAAAYAWSLYKRFERQLCRVRFDVGVAQGDIADITSNKITLPSLDGPEGQEFIGWSDGENIYQPGDTYYPMQDMTFHAIFLHVDYTILSWEESAIVIQTTDDVASVTTQVTGESEVQNTLSMCELDAGIYRIATSSLLNQQGKILTLSFRDGENRALPASEEIIPLITNTSNYTTEGLTLTDQSDIVVLPNTKLTIESNVTMDELTVLGGGKVIIPEGITLTANRIYLHAGQAALDNYNTYIYSYPQLTVNGTVNVTLDTIFFDYLLNKAQQYTFAVPQPVKRADIKAITGENVSFKVAEYHGDLRAKDEQGWAYTDDETFVPGKGYTIFATPLTVIGSNGKPTRQKYVTLRMPMVVSENYTEKEDRSVALTQYPSSIAPGLANWNLISVPFMCNYSGGLNVASVAQTYVTIPDDLGSSYTNYETADASTILPAFKNFFVQAAAEGELTFANAYRQTAAPWRQDDAVNNDYRTGIELSQGTVSDRVGLLIGDAHTPAYEMNADLNKWMNAVLSVYAIVDGNTLAYAAISPEMAADKVAIGYKTTKKGTYTFSLNHNYNLSMLQAVWLTDYETGEVTNLLYDEYTFTTKATTNNTRFALTVVRYAQQIPKKN